MKILILGGTGMLGHRLYKSLSSKHEVKTTSRRHFSDLQHLDIFNKNAIYDNADILNQNTLLNIVSDFQPEAIINAVGLIKQRADKENAFKNIQVNALFPHQLSLLGKACNARIIHFSTDCIFNGEKGGYTESDCSNATDIYGRTKYLGELQETHTITLRSSIIGFELFNKSSLLEWVLSQHGKIRGFTKALFTGFTTDEMARIVENILVNYPEKHGTYQVSSDPINKYELITLINQAFELNLDIEPYDDFECYRDLNSDRFRKEFQYTPPSWFDMITELAKQHTILSAV